MRDKMFTILVADDDAEICELIRLYLEKEGYEVLLCADGLEVLQTMQKKRADLLLLDIMMPGLNGYDLIRWIRAESTLPIIMVSAKVTPAEKVLALDMGADDYISKPFDPLELLSRVQALLRRTTHFTETETRTLAILSCNGLKLDPSSCELWVEGTPVPMTATEQKILQLLLGEPGRVFTREQIYQAGWGDAAVDDNSIQVAISKLRAKIGEWRIRTIRGLGYRLEKELPRHE